MPDTSITCMKKQYFNARTDSDMEKLDIDVFPRCPRPIEVSSIL